MIVNETQTAWSSLAEMQQQHHSENDHRPNQEILDSKGRIYATGKRKTSVARVWIKPGGQGRVLVNGRTQEEYFGRATLCQMIASPFQKAGRSGLYDVMCTVQGGGLSGQAGAVSHGVSKALQLYEPSLRAPLKAAGLLTRDSRRVERKKPGLRKARRRPQFSKR
jgi:small subunit ribosomal protein S9